MFLKRERPETDDFVKGKKLIQFYSNLGPKRYLGRRDPIIGSIG